MTYTYDRPEKRALSKQRVAQVQEHLGFELQDANMAGFAGPLAYEASEWLFFFPKGHVYLFEKDPLSRTSAKLEMQMKGLDSQVSIRSELYPSTADYTSITRCRLPVHFLHYDSCGYPTDTQLVAFEDFFRQLAEHNVERAALASTNTWWGKGRGRFSKDRLVERDFIALQKHVFGNDIAMPERKSSMRGWDMSWYLRAHVYYLSRNYGYEVSRNNTYVYDSTNSKRYYVHFWKITKG